LAAVGSKRSTLSSWIVAARYCSSRRPQNGQRQINPVGIRVVDRSAGLRVDFFAVLFGARVVFMAPP
jgi:hypothetical protein